MDTQTILSIIIVAILFITFIIWLAWQIKKKGLKQFATDMIVLAERLYKKGENEQKMDFVIDKIIGKLPTPLSFFITRNAVKSFAQNVFDIVKKALDYVPKEG